MTSLVTAATKAAFASISYDDLTKTVGITVVIVIIALLLLKELARAFNERRIVDWMHVLDLALLPLLLVLAIIVTARLAELVH